jgi:hypothetical protein
MRKRTLSAAFAVVICLLTLPTVSVLSQAPCSLGTEYKHCRACGTAKRSDGKRLNVEKNRDEGADNVEVLTIPQIRRPSNNDKFTAEMPVEVTGFVASVVPGGTQETCNCARSDLQDIHINVVATPQERNNEKRYVIVEFTPRWQEQFGLDNSNYKEMLKEVKKEIEGKWVLFQGWMMYDSMHVGESESTAPGRKKNWRATPWEVHPITYYEVLDGPP